MSDRQLRKEIADLREQVRGKGTMTDCCCAQEKAAMRAKIVRLEADGSKAMTVVMALQKQLRRRDELLDSPELLERLSGIEHERWSGWMKHLFSKCEDGGIPSWAWDRWTRQANTPYAKLSEQEKESDRKEARTTLTAIREAREGQT